MKGTHAEDEFTLYCLQIIEVLNVEDQATIPTDLLQLSPVGPVYPHREDDHTFVPKSFCRVSHIILGFSIACIPYICNGILTPCLVTKTTCLPCSLGQFPALSEISTTPNQGFFIQLPVGPLAGFILNLKFQFPICSPFLPWFLNLFCQSSLTTRSTLFRLQRAYESLGNFLKCKIWGLPWWSSV